MSIRQSLKEILTDENRFAFFQALREDAQLELFAGIFVVEERGEVQGEMSIARALKAVDKAEERLLVFKTLQQQAQVDVFQEFLTTNTQVVHSAPLEPGERNEKRRKLEDGGPKDGNIFMILKGLPLVSMRRVVLTGMREDAKLEVLFPSFKTHGLPVKDVFPPWWEKWIDVAETEVRALIELRFAEVRVEVESEVKVQSEDAAESGDDADWDVYGDEVLQQMGAVKEDERDNDRQNQLSFLKLVRICYPILAYGFEVETANRQDYCFCPCVFGLEDESVAGRCRQLCGMSTILRGSKCNKRKGCVGKAPGPFIDHLKDKKSSCNYHLILYDFLAEVYGWEDTNGFYDYLFRKNND